MNPDTILTHVDALGRATLTMNRPEVHNAFDDALIAGLTSQLKSLESNPEVRVVLLAASGKSFSAGADLNWMRRMAEYTPEENLADAMALAELMQTLNSLAKPTIGLVHGPAYGGGVGLVAACDIVLATSKASFCLSEVKLGLIPAVISPYVVAAIGQRQARRYFISAERFDAAKALELGLVHEIVAEGELEQAADRLSLMLLNNGPDAMAEAKRLMSDVSGLVIDEALINKTAQRIADIRASSEGQEGLTAFLEKRRPSWVPA